MKIRSLAVVLALLLLAGIAFGQDYTIDKGHTLVAFSARHMVISTVHGRFNDFTGVIHYDPKDITKSSVEVDIKTASVNTDNAARDNDLHGSELLDVAKYPDMTFKSKKIEKRGNGYVAIGDFTLKGVTKPIELPFTIAGPVQAFGAQRIAVEAHTKINRRDYNVTYSHTLQDGSALVGDEITIDLTIEAVLKK
jgi:polyisoprenoid-binding protein YceI